MPRRCCVPCCKSNYPSASNTGYVSVFFFPKDEVIKSKWLKQIHRENFVATKESVVCILHFDERFIIREDSAVRDDGSVLTVARKKPKLLSDAFPTIFPNQPTYMSSELPPVRKKPEDRLQEQMKRQEEKISQYLVADKITDFEELKKKFPAKLSTNWYGFHSENDIYIVKYDPLLFPKPSISIRIVRDLSVAVWKQQMPVPSNSLRWLLGPMQKCECWSTFDSLLSYMNSCELSDTDQLNSISILLDQCANDCKDEDLFEKLRFLQEQFKLLIASSPKYSTDMLLWSCTFFYSYPTAYKKYK